MKHLWRILALLAVLLMLAAPVLAEESIWEEDAASTVAVSALRAQVAASGADVDVYTTEMDGVHWLFLPSFADADELRLTLNGAKVDWTPDAEEAGVTYGQAVCEDGAEMTLCVMKSQNLRALFLFSDDPVNQGRAFIDNCERHVNETTGMMAVISPDGTVNYAGKLRQLRGRGNYTWQRQKKPYQFKLESKADLLMTGDQSECSRTWVLLAETSDGSLLRNRMSMDLALEMGIDETPFSEHVDLYYDGEYRGTYLLTEKVEVGEGRLEVSNYDEMMEIWNQSAGISDPELLEVGVGQTKYGTDFTYIKGVAEADDPSVGTFVMEMEHEGNTLSDRCFLRMEDGSVIAAKNPENPSESMMRYVSERLIEARHTLQNGGVNPDNGRTIRDDFDVDAFAKLLLLNELAHNTDSYYYSSSWFILPEGETRFRPGPAWDFDLAWRYFRKGVNEKGMGVKDLTGWHAEFYSCPEFMQAMQRAYEETLYPIVTEILLGDKQGTYLRPLWDYADEIAASRAMNDVLWDCEYYDYHIYGETPQEEVELLYQFIEERNAWLYDAVMNAQDGADAIDLWAYAGYMHVQDTLKLNACPWNHVNVAFASCTPLTEATEDEYATWALEAYLMPEEGYAFEEPSVTINGTPITGYLVEDGSALYVYAEFEDPSYRPVDYWGEDIGMFYNPDVYAQNYPEIAAQFEGDPEGLMTYFCDEGMYQDQMGNAFFRPSEVLQYNPELLGVLGTDWELYYFEFSFCGYEEGWMRKVDKHFALECVDVPE
ncbi:MAG: CotH kinase family protein [bacterium]|nr:CotH kinase family protein [bacterium]